MLRRGASRSCRNDFPSRHKPSGGRGRFGFKKMTAGSAAAALCHAPVQRGKSTRPRYAPGQCPPGRNHAGDAAGPSTAASQKYCTPAGFRWPRHCKNRATNGRPGPFPAGDRGAATPLPGRTRPPGGGGAAAREDLTANARRGFAGQDPAVPGRTEGRIRPEQYGPAVAAIDDSDAERLSCPATGWRPPAPDARGVLGPPPTRRPAPSLRIALQPSSGLRPVGGLALAFPSAATGSLCAHTAASGPGPLTNNYQVRLKKPLSSQARVNQH